MTASPEDREKGAGRLPRPSPEILLLAVAVLIIAALIALAAYALLNQRPTGPRVEGNGVHWKTPVVDLTAADFWIEAGGQRFFASTPVTVSSDPGNPTYRTLELTWTEHGTEMRMNIYFGGDATAWWVDEIRTYDGTPRPDWLYYKASTIRAPLGQAWAGDVDLTSIRSEQPGRGPGRLHFASLRLTSSPVGP